MWHLNSIDGMHIKQNIVSGSLIFQFLSDIIIIIITTKCIIYPTYLKPYAQSHDGYTHKVLPYIDAITVGKILSVITRACFVMCPM